MIDSITGIVRRTASDFCVVESGGVGYRCNASSRTLSALPGKGEAVTLFTTLVVREDALTLYGFLTEAERLCFELLTGVTGVGPKSAVALLSSLTPERLFLAIAADDLAELTGAPGIGRKTAQRIVLELRDRVAGAAFGDGPPGAAGSGSGAAPAESAGDRSPKSEAVRALVALGFSRTDAAAAVSREPDTLAADELVRNGLRTLGDR